MATNINVLDHAPDTLIRALGWILAPFEDPTGLSRPLCRDYSRWQEIVDYDIAFLNGVLLSAARSTISWGYQDAWFPRNWEEPGRVGLYRTSYHVIYPDQDIIRQADNWYHVHPEIDIVPRVIDLEKQNDTYPGLIADRVWELSNVVLSRDGIRPIIYSRYLLIDEWLKSWTTDMLNDHWYWLAQYLWDRSREHPGPPTLPNRVREDRVIMHQTADKKAGFPGEVGSRSVDWDRWELGNVVEMHKFINDNWGPTTPKQCWYEEIDKWARTNGFNSIAQPPLC